MLFFFPPVIIYNWVKSKSNLDKAAGAEVVVERKNEKLHTTVAKITF